MYVPVIFSVRIDERETLNMIFSLLHAPMQKYLCN